MTLVLSIALKHKYYLIKSTVRIVCSSYNITLSHSFSDCLTFTTMYCFPQLFERPISNTYDVVHDFKLDSVRREPYISSDYALCRLGVFSSSFLIYEILSEEL